MQIWTWHFRSTSASYAIARLASASGLISMAVITQVRMVSNSISWGSVGMICRENVTCRGGFGISIGRPERIGELGYTAITLGGAKA